MKPATAMRFQAALRMRNTKRIFRLFLTIKKITPSLFLPWDITYYFLNLIILASINFHCS